MTRVVVDVETRSDLDLAVVGAYRYARHPGTDVVCVSLYDVADPTNYVSLQQPALQWLPDLASLLSLRDDEMPTLLAYNDRFDAAIWKYILTPRYGWLSPDLWRWECLMQRAAYANLPGKLEKVAQVLGTPGKDAAGHRLMLQLCKPARAIQASSDPWRLHTQENINRLSDYCDADCLAESALDPILPALPECELPVMRADRAMNERGIHVDLARVDKMQAVATLYSERLRERLGTLTGGVVESETALPDLRRWLGGRNVPLRTGPGSLDRHAIASLLDTGTYFGENVDLDDATKEVLTIRKLLGKSSLAKLEALKAATEPTDSRVRGMFQYLGASQTGRWAGRIIQPQNLPKGILKGAEAYDLALWAIDGGIEHLELMFGDQLMDVLASCLRCCLTATPGNDLYVVDYNAIECRFAAWVAGETWLLDAFREGRDPYKQMAHWIYGVPVEQIGKDQRNVGKTAELSCQYGLGWKRFKVQAALSKVYLDDAQAQRVVTTYREKHPNIKRRWRELEDAAIRATRSSGTVTSAGPFAFKHDGENLRMRLPSGRCIRFNKATVEMRPPPWDSEELRPVLCYWTEDSQTHQWVPTTAWGGDFMAYGCQGGARDLIAHAMVMAESANYCPVLTVHDELGFDLAPGVASLPDLEAFVCQLPAWATGLPIRAEGFVSSFYHK